MSRNHVSRALKPCDISLTERNFRVQGIVYVESLQVKETFYQLSLLALTFSPTSIISYCSNCEPPTPACSHSCQCVDIPFVYYFIESRTQTRISCCLSAQMKGQGSRNME